MQTFVIDLDVDPLSAIGDHDKEPFGFFETLPHHGPSRTRKQSTKEPPRQPPPINQESTGPSIQLNTPQLLSMQS